MSNFCAYIEPDLMEEANLILEEQGHGPGNFSMPPIATKDDPVHPIDQPYPGYSRMHAWGDPVFEEHVAAIPGVIIEQVNPEVNPL